VNISISFRHFLWIPIFVQPPLFLVRREKTKKTKNKKTEGKKEGLSFLGARVGV